MMRTIQLAVVALLALGAPAMAQDIKVGAIFPLSGGAGPDGQTVTNAVKLMVDEINAKGGLLGRKLVVVSKDDESTPAVGVSRANEMIAEKADVVIEGWNSPVTLAMQPILARDGVLDITAVSKSDLILAGETNPYAIRINSSNGFDAAVIAKYVADTLKAKTIGMDLIFSRTTRIAGPGETMTETFSRNSSSTRPGSRSGTPSADRATTMILLPSTYPTSLRPARKLS